MKLLLPDEKWKAFCLGSEGYQVRRVLPEMSVEEKRLHLREFASPIVEVMGGSFETQKVNAHLISASPDTHDALKDAVDAYERFGTSGFMAYFQQHLPQYKQALAKAERT